MESVAADRIVSPADWLFLFVEKKLVYERVKKIDLRLSPSLVFLVSLGS